MSTISLVLTILFVNRVRSAQINVTGLNLRLEERSKVDLALQIRATTSEADPAVSGNNPSAADSLSENPREILAVYFEDEKGTNKELSEKGNYQFVSPFDENKRPTESKNERNKVEAAASQAESKNNDALALVWDGCLENTSKDAARNNWKAQSNMENERIVTKDENERRYLSSWNKRDANNSEAFKTWFGQHHNLMNQPVERRQHKEPTITTNITSLSPTTMTVQTIPITKEIFIDQTTDTYINEGNHDKIESSDNDIRVRLGQAEDWFEVQDRTKIRFGGVPRTDKYLIPSLTLEGGFHPFSFMSEFFSLIYPFEFPLGLIKDIFWGKFTFPLSFLQSIKVESTFLGFVISFGCIALVIPSYLCVLGILSLMSRSDCSDETETGTLFPEAEGSDCNGGVVGVFTLFTVLLCCTLISGMAVSNEQASSAATIASDAMSCAGADLATWVGAAARDLQRSIIPPVDSVVQAIREDLRNVETLLGEPIQQAIASESGINLVLDSLKDVVNESEDLSSKISALRDVTLRAGSLASSATDKVKDLARQLNNLKKNCNFKDAPLCDTINTNSLEMFMRFDLILREHRLLELRSLGVENLTQTISDAKQQLRGLPSAVTTQTANLREGPNCYAHQLTVCSKCCDCYGHRLTVFRNEYRFRNVPPCCYNPYSL